MESLVSLKQITCKRVSTYHDIRGRTWGLTLGRTWGLTLGRTWGHQHDIL